MTLEGRAPFLQFCRTFSAQKCKLQPKNVKSTRLLAKDVNRRLREKICQTIVQQSSDPEIASQPAQNLAASQQIFSSVTVERYLRNHLKDYSDQFPDLAPNLADLTAQKQQHGKRNLAKFAPQQENPKLQYPYRPNTEVLEPNAAGTETETISQKPDQENLLSDRGFYVRSDTFKDEYIYGSAQDLPQEKQFSNAEDDNKGEMKHHPGKVDQEQMFLKRMGPADAVEEIEFQVGSNKNMHVYCKCIWNKF